MYILLLVCTPSQLHDRHRLVEEVEKLFQTDLYLLVAYAFKI